MVLTTPMELTYTRGIESVLLNHTRTTGPSVNRMRDFYYLIPDKSRQRGWRRGVKYSGE